jgi:hypothetical protein
MPSGVFPVLASHDDTYNYLTPPTWSCVNEGATLLLRWYRPPSYPMFLDERAMIGLLFDTVTVPKGSRIISAHLRIRAAANWPSMDVMVRGIDQGDPPTFESPNCVADSRPSTTAAILWITGAIVGGTWYESSSLASIVQELVDRADYASKLALKLSQYGGGTEMTFSSFDAGHPPELHVTWQSIGAQGFMI